MPQYRVSLGFVRLADGDLPPFATQTVNGLAGNASFPNPTVPPATVTAQITDYITKLAAVTDGTRQDTVLKDLARLTLENSLRQNAAYVQSLAGEDLPMLLSSGYETMSTNRAQIELPKPEVIRVENPASSQLALRLKPIYTARAYEVRISYGPNGWQSAGVFTQARRIVLTDLTPGTTYNIQVRAIGGSTGASDWSDPVSHMSL